MLEGGSGEAGGLLPDAETQIVEKPRYRDKRSAVPGKGGSQRKKNNSGKRQ